MFEVCEHPLAGGVRSAFDDAESVAWFYGQAFKFSLSHDVAWCGWHLFKLYSSVRSRTLSFKHKFVCLLIACKMDSRDALDQITTTTDVCHVTLRRLELRVLRALDFRVALRSPHERAAASDAPVAAAAHVALELTCHRLYGFALDADRLGRAAIDAAYHRAGELADVVTRMRAELRLVEAAAARAAVVASPTAVVEQCEAAARSSTRRRVWLLPLGATLPPPEPPPRLRRLSTTHSRSKRAFEQLAPESEHAATSTQFDRPRRR